MSSLIVRDFVINSGLGEPNPPKDWVFCAECCPNPKEFSWGLIVGWPKLGSEEVATNLAFTGTIKDDILEKTEIAFSLLKYLVKNYKQNQKTLLHQNK